MVFHKDKMFLLLAFFVVVFLVVVYCVFLGCVYKCDAHRLDCLSKRKLHIYKKVENIY